MRALAIAGIVTLAFTGTAFAQMCGGGMQQQTASQGSGMSCMGMTQAADDPMAEKPASKPMMSGMMCPCCKNMASMGSMKPQSDESHQHQHEPPAEKQ